MHRLLKRRLAPCTLLPDLLSTALLLWTVVPLIE